MRSRLLAMGAVVLATLLLAGMTTQVAATESWETVGYSWARGRGEHGTPQAFVATTTKREPSAVQIHVYTDDPKPKVTHVYWRIDCWKKGDERTEFLSDTGNRDLPFVKEFSRTDLPMDIDPDYCQVRVSAEHEQRGRVNVKVRAQYGTG